MAQSTPETVSPFLQLLANLEEGTLQAQLADELKEIVGALTAQARDSGGKPKAKLVLALDFKLDSGMVEVTGAVKTVMPKPVRGKSVFWTTPDHQLSGKNPKQLELPIRDVATPAAAGIRALP